MIWRTPPTLAEILEPLGGVPLERVIADPPPGKATEEDVRRLASLAEKRICELIDGVLVEKAMGFLEGRLGQILSRLLDQFAEEHDLGIVLGDQGPIRMAPLNIRIPDVAFYAKERLIDGMTPLEWAPQITPDLVIEVLSPSNTKGEIARKRRDYFGIGTRLFWEIDPRRRRASIWTTVELETELDENGFLDGGEVLPGFRIGLGELFAKLKMPPTE